MKAKRVARDFPVVCVGGSAGGLDAYIRLLQNLPADLGVAIVILNHMRTVATMLPESAIDTGCIDFILAPESIATEIARIARSIK
jgi:chemotaxis response regulator CheB